MKFYFSKDTSTVNSRFVIYDELGHVKCYVLRDYSHSYWNLVITDISFNKLCTIYSVPLPFMKACPENWKRPKPDTILTPP